jgi:hypothetical protein
VLVELLERQQLHRMRDEHHPVIRHPEHPSLLERFVDERLGRHRCGGYPQPLEPHHVVHTARRTGASVG